MHQGIRNLENTCLEIEDLLSKLKNKREKRSLFNGVGTAIKYITGNPDNDDLVEINKNINSLYENQEKIIKQIDKYNSFANHVTERYLADLKSLQNNINATAALLRNVSNVLETQLLLQYNSYLSMKILTILRTIERTISLAFSGIVNLEIISNSELGKIADHLRIIYKESELLSWDNIHPYKILEFSKLRVISINDIITCMLYIPILKTSLYQYSQIYPLPNSQEVVLIPPARFHLQGAKEELWTEENCQTIDEQIVCTNKPSVNKCSLRLSENCTFAKVSNDYKLYTQLRNNKVIVSSKNELEVIEECSNKLNRAKVKNNVAVASEKNCKIIIESQTYDNTFCNLTVQSEPVMYNYKASKTLELNLHHLHDVNSLREEARELVSHTALHPITHYAHLSVTSVLLIIICVTCILCYVLRHKLRKYIMKQNDVTQLCTFANIADARTQNEDVLS